ncbi:head-tail adaptor protein [Sphingomonas sp. Leaf37]|uniref:head-tail adaptor protein n=1 Tax=Sphingomonas sp. Leaf37 TaxID=2876552 RepID=UPI001E2A4E99|nr:head-tail adaptor protein [Sphingomonas sp. Leaf37]
MAVLPAGSLNKRIRIEAPLIDNAPDSAGSRDWRLVAKVWANIQDVLPSRSEKLAEGINLSTRPARVRMRHRTNITPDMRFVYRDRVMQIVAGPAELGAKVGIEFMVEDYSTAGNSA